MCFRSPELDLNSRLVVIFVLRLAKPLSENTKRNRSAKVKVTQCLALYPSPQYFPQVYSIYSPQR